MRIAGKSAIALIGLMGCATDSIHFEDRDFYRIESACLSRVSNPKKLESQIQAAFTQGLSCLKSLDPEGKKKTYDLIENMVDFYGHIDITCPNEISDEVLAQAGARNYHSYFAPKIELNTKTLEQHATDENYLARVVLHEMLHIPGYDHENTIDYAYACEYHCFPPKQLYLKGHANDAAKYAHDICNGQYDDPDDIEYLREINNLQLVDEPVLSVITKRVHAAILRHPKNKTLKLMLAMYLLNSKAWPVAYHLAYQLSFQYAGEKLTPKEKEWFENLSTTQKNYKIPTEFEEPARLLAESYMACYDGDISACASRLKAISLPPARKSKHQKAFAPSNQYFEFLMELIKKTIESDGKPFKRD